MIFSGSDAKSFLFLLKFWLDVGNDFHEEIIPILVN